MISIYFLIIATLVMLTFMLLLRDYPRKKNHATSPELRGYFDPFNLSCENKTIK